MVDHESGTRNSLQHRLERSRRYRNRGTAAHNDSHSVGGDSSVVSTDNASVVSGPSSMASKMKRHDAVKETTSSSVPDNASVRSQSSIIMTVDKAASRRQRLIQKSLKNKHLERQNPPVKNSGVPTATDDGAALKSNDAMRQESEPMSFETKTVANAVMASTKPEAPSPVQTEARDAESDMQASRLYQSPKYQSPKHQAASPCESVMYQTNEMVESDARSEGANHPEDEINYAKIPVAKSSPDTALCAGKRWQRPELREQMGNKALGASDSIMEKKPRAVVVTPTKKFPSLRPASESKIYSRAGLTGKILSTNQPAQQYPKTAQSPTITVAPSTPSRAEAVGRDYRAKYDSQHQQPRLTPTRNSKHSEPYSVPWKKPMVAHSSTPVSHKIPQPIVTGSSSCVKQSPSFVGRVPNQRNSVGGFFASCNQEGSVTAPCHSNDGSMYKDILRPVRRDRGESANPTQKVAYGGVIETPKSVKVSSLRASFDNPQNQPIMPMNSKDPRVCHSLPLPSADHSKTQKKHGAVKESTVDTLFHHQYCHRDQKDHCLQQTQSLPEHTIEESQTLNHMTLPKIDIDSSPVKSEAPNTPVSSVSPSIRSGPSSPIRGVAEKYRASTGRSVVDHEQESTVKPEHEAEIEDNSHIVPSQRVQKYYKATWRVHTNDFAVEAEQENDNSQSPRQSVLSSWNRKFQEKQVKYSQGKAKPNSIEANSAETTQNLKKDSDDCSYPQAREDSEMKNFARQVKSSTKPTLAVLNCLSLPPEHDTQHSESSNARGKVRDQQHYDTGHPVSQAKAVAKKLSLLSTWQQWEDSNKSSNRSFVSDYCEKKSVHAEEISALKFENAIFVQHDVEFSQLETNLEGSTDVTNDGEYNGVSEFSLDRSDESSKINIPLCAEEGHQSNNDAINEKLMMTSEDMQEGVGANKFTSPLPQPMTQVQSTDQACVINKPWEKDSKNSVVQAWQMRTSRNREAEHQLNNQSQNEAVQDDCATETTELLQNDLVPHLQGEMSETLHFLEEKKSNDLSIDENIIIGVVEEKTQPARERNDSDSGLQLAAYDDDSYISISASGRARADLEIESAVPEKSLDGDRNDFMADLEQVDSEEISLYVEDEDTQQGKKLAIVSNKVTPKNQVETVNEANELTDIKKVQVMTGDQATNGIDTSHDIPEESTTPRKNNQMRINPSPKDSTKYRIGYFGDESQSTAAVHGASDKKDEDTKKESDRVIRSKAAAKRTTKETTTDDVDIWAVSSVSEDEQDEDIQFNDADDWLNRDPEVAEEMGEDNSISTEQDNISEGKFASNESPSKVSSSGFDVAIPILAHPHSWTQKDKKGKESKQKLQETPIHKVAFNPFDDDVEAAAAHTEALFSPSPDPFTTEESFSPLDWSSPQGSSAQHIGYYNSPDDYRLEI
jgi:hypothetical protein